MVKKKKENLSVSVILQLLRLGAGELMGGEGGIRTIQLLHNAVRQAGVVWAQGFSAKCSRTLRSSASSSCSGWSGAPSVFTGRSPGLEEKTAHNRPTAVPLLKLY